jgi:hypothetical protein
MALGVIPGAPDSEAKTFVDLKVDLEKEKVAQVAAQIEADMISRAFRDLKVFVDRLATQIPILEDKLKYLEDKVVEGLNEVRARELFLEHTTWANDDYQTQVAQLTKKPKSKFSAWVQSVILSVNHSHTDPTSTHRIRC